MKTAFIHTITDLMRKHDDIITVTADMGYSVFEELEKEFPKRFFNTGVTEQSTIGLSAGLAMSGYTVFVYAQSIFLTLRALEQIRLDIAYHFANVKIIGTAAGFWLNQLGVSHTALEDVGVMRLLPGMTILSPGDPWEAAWATQKAYETPGSVYVRFGKPDNVFVHTKPISTDLGDILPIIKGIDNITLLVSGGLLPNAVQIAKKLKKMGISISVYSVPTIKPLNSSQLHKILLASRYMFTLEEHCRTGGLGSVVSEYMTDNDMRSVHLVRLGTPDQFIHVAGTREYLLSLSGLSNDAICEAIRTRAV